MIELTFSLYSKDNCILLSFIDKSSFFFKSTSVYWH